MMRAEDIHLPLPAYFKHDASIHDAQHHGVDGNAYYLAAMCDYAKFSGEIWDRLFAQDAEFDVEMEQVLVDARLAHWSETVLPRFTAALCTSDTEPVKRRQSTLVQTVRIIVTVHA
jgi:hypothetical protein